MKINFVGHTILVIVLVLLETSTPQTTTTVVSRSTYDPNFGGPPTKTTVTMTTGNGTNSTNTTLATLTVPLDADRMDINHEDLRNLLFMDLGTWSDQNFYYYNRQNMRVSTKKTDHESDNCFKEYFRCVGNQVFPSFICATNEMTENGANWNTYCEVYLDNCRKRMRYWYIVDVGYCQGYGNNQWFSKVIPTQKGKPNDPWIWDPNYPY
ncbi:uncharacterized protein LOC126378196 [Pectinophora gossypiella]|uniref:uncharacterized protein LOC126378196 n=1 Tax=Pectinophora gossypiella TaxID=13191 RepID=UPI00214E03FE|nr:uncharacterized protein LOC126378196 [Pectinophora gossypiella]